jgi:hypothetical protein
MKKKHRKYKTTSIGEDKKKKSKRQRTKGRPTGWYNNIVGGSIPPVPTRVDIEKRL